MAQYTPHPPTHSLSNNSDRVASNNKAQSKPQLTSAF